MARPRKWVPMAAAGTITADDDDDDKGGRGERDYARERVAPPALGRLTEGRS